MFTNDVIEHQLRHRSQITSSFTNDVFVHQLRHRFNGFYIDGTRGSGPEDCRDSLSDFPPQNHRQNRNANDEQKSDAILGEQERKAVRQVYFCQVHVDGVGGDEDDGEAEDDGPVGIRTSARSLSAVAGSADEQAEDGEETLKRKRNKFLFIVEKWMTI